MLAAAQCIYSIEPFAAVALLERAKALAPDSGEIAEWLEYVGSCGGGSKAPHANGSRSVGASSARCAASLRELGDPNDPSLAARLKSAHSGPKLIELAEQYQQMARVAYDAHVSDDCWLGAQISLQLLDSFTKNPDHAPRLAESAASAGAPSSRPGTPSRPARGS